MGGVIGQPRPDPNPGGGGEGLVGITSDRYSKSLFLEDGIVSDLMVAVVTTVNSSGSMVPRIQGSPDRGKTWFNLQAFPTVTSSPTHDFIVMRRGEFYSMFRLFADWASGDFDLTLHAIPRNRESGRLDLETLPALFD